MSGEAGPPSASGHPARDFPLGAAITLDELAADPHPGLAALRAAEPVSWLPALGGWLVTRHDLALRVLRDAASFTVDDPRFSTAQVVGPSMLSLDGAEHDRHRSPFRHAFGGSGSQADLAEHARYQAHGLVARVAADGVADLRESVAGPLAVAVMARALGLQGTEPAALLAWYRAIVDAVSGIAAGAPVSEPGREAFGMLSAALRSAAGAGSSSLLAEAAAAHGSLSGTEVVSNAAVVLFGGIDTTEGMITNAVFHLLTNPGQLALVTGDPGLVAKAVEESLRLEPAAAVVDRYATADVTLGGAPVGTGDLVTVSLAGAGRDPAVFADPDRFDLRRENSQRHLAFARGPHFCLGAQLARAEAQAAVAAILSMLPGLRLDPARPSAPRGLVFRKPPSLWARWDPA